LHNLLVLKGTPLESDYEAGRYSPPSLDRYADMAVNFLERIPWGMAVHRLAASAPARLLVAPAWASDKGAVIRTIEGELEKRGAYQGRLASIGCGCINNRLEERLEMVHQA
jgi:radical SAM superfamily enzyme